MRCGGSRQAKYPRLPMLSRRAILARDIIVRDRSSRDQLQLARAAFASLLELRFAPALLLKPRCDQTRVGCQWNTAI